MFAKHYVRNFFFNKYKKQRVIALNEVGSSSTAKGRVKILNHFACLEQRLEGMGKLVPQTDGRAVCLLSRYTKWTKNFFIIVTGDKQCLYFENAKLKKNLDWPRATINIERKTESLWKVEYSVYLWGNHLWSSETIWNCQQIYSI